MSTEKAKELLHQIRSETNLALCVATLDSIKMLAKKALAALDEKPESTSEFTKTNRIAIQQCKDAYEEDEWMKYGMGLGRLEEACNIIDRLESENKQQVTKIAKLEKSATQFGEYIEKLRLQILSLEGKLRRQIVWKEEARAENKKQAARIKELELGIAMMAYNIHLWGEEKAHKQNTYDPSSVLSGLTKHELSIYRGALKILQCEDFGSLMSKMEALKGENNDK